MGFLGRFTKKKKDKRVALAEQFASMLLVHFPSASWSEIEPMLFLARIPGRDELRINLENLFRECRDLDKKEADDLVERFFDTITGVSAADEEPITIERIIPVIKDQEFLDHVGGNSSPTTREHLAADLWIMYMVDQPTRMLALMKEDFDNLGVPLEALKVRAIENLRALLPGVQRYGDGNWFLIGAGDYTASVLLLDKVWDELADAVEGDLVVAVPTRDILLVTGSASAEGIAAVRAKAIELAEGGSYTISQTLLRRKSAKWVALS